MKLPYALEISKDGSLLAAYARETAGFEIKEFSNVITKDHPLYTMLIAAPTLYGALKSATSFIETLAETYDDMGRFMLAENLRTMNHMFLLSLKSAENGPGDLIAFGKSARNGPDI